MKVVKKVCVGPAAKNVKTHFQKKFQTSNGGPCKYACVSIHWLLHCIWDHQSSQNFNRVLKLKDFDRSVQLQNYGHPKIFNVCKYGEKFSEKSCYLEGRISRLQDSKDLMY